MSTFPTFEEIKAGYFTYEQQGRYLGEDDHGNPRFARMRAREIVIEHNRFDRIFKLYAMQDKKFKTIESFKIVYANGNYASPEPYTAEGFEAVKRSLLRAIEQENQLCLSLKTEILGARQ